MRAVTLLVVVEDDLDADVHVAEAAMARAFPGVAIDRVELIEEERLGAWLRAHRAKRCRTVADVLRTPERQQPVVVDIDVPR